MSGERTFSFTEECDYGATPERVYHMLVYPDTLPGLDDDVRRWEPEELPPRIGTVNRMKLRVFGVPTFLRFESRFAELDPPHRFVVEGVRPAFVSGVRWIVTLEPISGGTHATTTMEAPASRWAPLARASMFVLRRAVRRGMRALHERLGPPR